MALIQSILNWWNRRRTAAYCKKYGHIPLCFIEKYEKVVRAKNYRIGCLDGLMRTRPYNEISIRGKLKCAMCDAVYLGIVKVDETVWTP